MRQEHVADDKVFVDYSGKKIGIVDPLTGETREAEIFVAVLGASGFTYECHRRLRLSNKPAHRHHQEDHLPGSQLGQDDTS
jgi:transposase